LCLDEQAGARGDRDCQALEFSANGSQDFLKEIAFRTEKTPGPCSSVRAAYREEKRARLYFTMKNRRGLRRCGPRVRKQTLWKQALLEASFEARRNQKTRSTRSLRFPAGPRAPDRSTGEDG